MVYTLTHMILHGLPCTSFSLITVRSHTLSNSQPSDSKQHPSHGHNASLGGRWEVAPYTQFRRCIIPTYKAYMESKSGDAIRNFTNVGKNHKPVSWVTEGSEILSFVLLCTREGVKHESCWRSLCTEQRASRPHYFLFTLGPLNSSAKDLLRDGPAAAEYSWAPAVGTWYFSYQTWDVWYQ